MYALLIAQNADETAILSLGLQRAGLAVNTGHDAERAVQNWPERPADLVMLSTSNEPLGQIARFRAVTLVPIVVIIDPVSEDVHCKLLEAGADLVVTRPYSARLLIARLRSLMRRAGGVHLFSLPALHLSGLTLDPATRSAQVNGRLPRRLTHLEFRLLYTLMIHRDQILSTEHIVERVWGYSGQGDKELVRGLVRRLRAKIEPDPGTPQYILTIPGVGYSFASDKMS